MHFVYILKFRDRDKVNSMFYTGETINIVRRYTQHLNKIRSNYLKRWHPNATKKLVYVETVESKQEGKKREQEIKALTQIQKEELILSDKNSLLSCDPNFGKPKIRLNTK